MTLVSYAQNFEDVMLWRALKHIENGFYVDIGAQDPVVDSVSLAFYEHGWRGVHVEPTQQYSCKLRDSRPDELIYQAAVGTGVDELVFFEFPDTGLSTANVDIAESHKKLGFKCIETVVPVISLDTLFSKLSPNNIHWLKLDVEGLEKDVLESWNTSSVRPWVLVIESTRPLSQDECHESWEYIVLAKGYKFVYSDGLNRFYVSSEHAELAESFKYPPNIFDDFSLSGLASQPFSRVTQSKLQCLKDESAQARTAYYEANEFLKLSLLNEKNRADLALERVNGLEKTIEENEFLKLSLLNEKNRADLALERVNGLEKTIEEKNSELIRINQENNNNWSLAEKRQQQIQLIYNSTSWRMTSPVRFLSNILKVDWRGKLKYRIKNISRHAFLYVNRRPKIKTILLTLFNKHPRVKRYLKRISSVQPMWSNEHSMQAFVPKTLTSLTPDECSIYMALKFKHESKIGGKE